MTGAIELSGLGGDLAYLAITTAFFGAAVGLLRACDRIVGRDDPAATNQPANTNDRDEPAPAPRREVAA